MDYMIFYKSHRWFGRAWVVQKVALVVICGGMPELIIWNFGQAWLNIIEGISQVNTLNALRAICQKPQIIESIFLG